MSYLSSIEEGEYRSRMKSLNEEERDLEKSTLEQLIEDTGDPFLVAGIALIKAGKAKEKLDILKEVVDSE